MGPCLSVISCLRPPIEAPLKETPCADSEIRTKALKCVNILILELRPYLRRNVYPPCQYLLCRKHADNGSIDVN